MPLMRILDDGRSRWIGEGSIAQKRFHETTAALRTPVSPGTHPIPVLDDWRTYYETASSADSQISITIDPFDSG